MSSYGTNALVVRAAKSLLASARQHAVLAATAKAADEDIGGGQVGDAMVGDLQGRCFVSQLAS
jgi:hypothetical protein